MPTPAELAETVSADCPAGEVLALRDEIERFLREAGGEVDARFREEFLSYYSPPGDGYAVRDWLQTLAAGLTPRPGPRR